MPESTPNGRAPEVSSDESTYQSRNELANPGHEKTDDAEKQFDEKSDPDCTPVRHVYCYVRIPINLRISRNNGLYEEDIAEFAAAEMTAKPLISIPNSNTDSRIHNIRCQYCALSFQSENEPSRQS